jgi:hypothetical protein
MSGEHRDRFVKCRLKAACHNNACALFDKLLGDAQSDTLPAAGDNGNFTLE